MRPELFEQVLSYEDARRRVLGAVRPIERLDNIDITDADGRVAARDVVAPVDVPAFDRALMDGYALRANDVVPARDESPVTLRLIDAVYTGDVPRHPVVPGTCVAIATGAPLPAGADAVVMVEQTAEEGGTVQVLARVTAGQNIGRRGADLAQGDIIVASGTQMSPARIGSLAAAGLTHVDVYARPTVAILSTGNEITTPGERLPPGHVYDVNRFTIGAVVARHGGTAVPIRAAGDTIDELTAALDQAAACDLIVFSGGSSVGSRDLMLDALQARGEIHFHGVAIKPGKPMLFGRVGSTAVFGMPGNPASCLSNAFMFLVPFLRMTARRPVWAPRTVRAATSAHIASTAGRHQFYPVRLHDGIAAPAFKSSSDITSLAHADGFIEIPADVTDVAAGSPVDVRMFD